MHYQCVRSDARVCKLRDAGDSPVTEGCVARVGARVVRGKIIKLVGVVNEETTRWVSEVWPEIPVCACVVGRPVSRKPLITGVVHGWVSQAKA